MIKLRFAPSPTGNLHVGNFRTALINFLYAKKHNGHFLLRLDDTDTERSKLKFEESIKEDLTWANINWDSEAKQSNRIERYNDVLKIFIEKEFVYPCYETAEELSLKRKSQLSSGKPPVYDRSSLNLSDFEKEEFCSKGLKPHYRFFLNHETIFWNDLVRGECKYNLSNVSDPILVREDGRFIYTLASVIDDIDLNITHIIRGEDHVTNSAAQLQIFDAMDAARPRMGHLPLMTDSKGEGLSKRIGSLSIKDLKKEEIESISLNSYLSSIGTSKNTELKKGINNIIEDFDISHFSRAPTKFNFDELNNINKKLIQQLDYTTFKSKFRDEAQVLDEKCWNIIKKNITSFKEVKEWNEIIFGQVSDNEIDEDVREVFFKTLPDEQFDEKTWVNWSQKIRENLELKNNEIFKLMRKVLTSRMFGPEMSELILILGREKIIERLKSK